MSQVDQELHNFFDKGFPKLYQQQVVFALNERTHTCPSTCVPSTAASY